MKDTTLRTICCNSPSGPYLVDLRHLTRRFGLVKCSVGRCGELANLGCNTCERVFCYGCWRTKHHHKAANNRRIKIV